jgi:hypothetical protein
MEFDIGYMADYNIPSYISNWYIQGNNNTAEVGTFYIDDIKVTWPVGTIHTKDKQHNGFRAGMDIRANPNPFSRQVLISLMQNANIKMQSAKLAVFDISGRQVYSAQVSRRSLHVWDARGHAPGIYCVRLTTGNQTIQKKVTLLK